MGVSLAENRVWRDEGEGKRGGERGENSVVKLGQESSAEGREKERKQEERPRRV